MKKVKEWNGTVKKNDDFGDKIIDSFIDGKTKHGPWAIMTPRSFALYGVGLGIGLGQRYFLNNNKWILLDEY
jgi:hypothetical protein